MTAAFAWYITFYVFVSLGCILVGALVPPGSKADTVNGDILIGVMFVSPVVMFVLYLAVGIGRMVF